MERDRDAHPDLEVKEIALFCGHLTLSVLKPHWHISLRLLRPCSNHLVTGLKLKLIKGGKETHKLLNLLMDGMDTRQDKCLWHRCVACSVSRPEEVGRLGLSQRIGAASVGKGGDVGCPGWRGGGFVTSYGRGG